MPRPAKGPDPRGRWRGSAEELCAILEEFGVDYPTAYLKKVETRKAPEVFSFPSKVPALLRGHAKLEPDEATDLFFRLTRDLPDAAERSGRLRARLIDAQTLDRETYQRTRLLDRAGCTAQIFWPEEEATIRTSWIDIQGRIDGLPLRCEAILVARVDREGLIWPKEPRLQIANGEGSFTARIYEGGRPGRRYYSVVMVNETGLQDFADWLRRGAATNHYPGLTADPTRMVELVTRNFTWFPET